MTTSVGFVLSCDFSVLIELSLNTFCTYFWHVTSCVI